MLTADRLRELLHYDPETGLFTWLVRRQCAGRPGQVAGTPHGKGYLVIGLLGRRYFAHRLAWLYVYGRWPEHDIDHIDEARANNRITNLREATNAQNLHNISRAYSSNRTSGLLGVSWDGSRSKWVARIEVNGKRINLGRFDTKERAKECRDRVAAVARPFGPEARR